MIIRTFLCRDIFQKVKESKFQSVFPCQIIWMNLFEKVPVLAQVC